MARVIHSRPAIGSVVALILGREPEVFGDAPRAGEREAGIEENRLPRSSTPACGEALASERLVVGAPGRRTSSVSPQSLS